MTTPTPEPRYILLANIGNRNLKLKADARDMADIAKEKKLSFRAYTQQLWHELQAGKRSVEDFDIAIIPEMLLRHHAGECKAIHLFYSDQLPDVPQNGQDTVYSSQIIGKVLEASGYSVILNKIDFSVVDYERLMKYYRRHLIKLLEDVEQDKIILLDAGGTSQQKLSLKIVAEFLVPEERLEVYNGIIRADKGTDIEPVPLNEYRSILSVLQAEQLIEQGLYHAALNLLGEKTSPVLQIALRTLSNQIDSIPMDGEQRNAIEQLKSGKFGKSDFKLLSDFPQSTLAYNPLIHDNLLKNCQRRLSIAEFYDKKESYTDFILSAYQFIEEFLDSCAKVVLNVENKYKNENIIIKQEFHPEWIEAAKEVSVVLDNYDKLLKNEGKQGVKLSVYTLSELCCQANDEVLKGIATGIRRFIYFQSIDEKKAGISQLRNKMVHDGTGVTKEIIGKNLPGFIDTFRTWPALLGLPEENYFIRANKLLKEELRKM